MATFFINNKTISISSLKYNSKEIQLESMRSWFLENYEDPANSCPYESREGGIFIFMEDHMMQVKCFKKNLAAM
ncbi:hypothetical protein VEE11_38070 [Escherichia coli]|nr:hypothetical protein VEE11_38070 [Escherichia coli]